MGAMITIKYEAQKVTDDEAATLAQDIQSLVAEEIGEKDVFVYAEKAAIVSGADPIEVFVQVNSRKITNSAGLTDAIATRLVDWKKRSGFSWPLNLNVIPVEWHSKVGL
jgi:hypothetical protein